MAISNAWRFGLPGSTYIDLPEPQIGGLQVAYLEVGGAARSAGGTYLKDRTGAVKRQWTMTLDPYTNATSWQPLEYLYTTQTGPFELYDPTVPNLLDLDARLGADWVTAAGVAITVNSNMRMALSASPASAQTAITTAPAVGNLFQLVRVDHVHGGDHRRVGVVVHRHVRRVRLHGYTVGRWDAAGLHHSPNDERSVHGDLRHVDDAVRRTEGRSHGRFGEHLRPDALVGQHRGR
jgi:hypothetical protein